MNYDEFGDSARSREADVKNSAFISGKMVSGYSLSHTVFGENFYTFDMLVPRLSQTCDSIPVTVSERLVNRERFDQGTDIYVSGQIRSYNHFVEAENRNRLILTVFAREYGITAPDEARYNDIFLDGFLCKQPQYRTTPFGREIADLLIAVNRSYNKSDYIPCIAWGVGANYSASLSVGDRLKLWGRMQSRVYKKKTADGECVDKVAYEVSVSRLS